MAALPSGQECAPSTTQHEVASSKRDDSSQHDDSTPETRPDSDPASEQAQVTEPRYSSFSSWEKRGIVLASAFVALFSPLSAQIYLPALNTLAEEFDVSGSKINLTVTSYMIFQGIVPMFIGSFADKLGRRPAYVICFVVYIGANIGLALAPNYTSLLVLRCLQSAGSSSTVSLCVAVGADLVTSAERGQYIGYTAVPSILGPSLGPVIGGLLVQYMGWRSIFWFLAILAGTSLAAIIMFFPETCRNIVGDGSVTPHPFYWTLPQSLRHRKSSQHDVENTLTGTEPERGRFRLPNPFGSLILLFEKGLGLLLSISSIVFAGFYAVGTSMPTQLREHYGLSDLHIGLMYLPMAGGSIMAAGIIGPLINKNYARHCRRLGIPLDKSRQQDLSNFPIERARLEIGTPLLYCSGVILVAWGWAMQARPHIAVICVLLFCMGISLIGFSNTTHVLITDVSPGRAATATAANNLTRCLVGAAATAAILPMIDGIGIGWAFTVIGALYGAVSPALFILMKKGVSWRKQANERQDGREEARRAKKCSPQVSQVLLSNSPLTGDAASNDEKGDGKTVAKR